MSKRYVVISSNNNPDYEFYVPIVMWAWQQLGWGVINLKPFDLPPYKEETITQCIRLYTAILKDLNGVPLEKDDILMTSDADMIPLSAYWNPDPAEITTYGRDLTDYHFPMCYIAMTKHRWGKVMNLNSNNIRELMVRDLQNTNALSEDRVKAWVTDQDIITDRLNKFSHPRTDVSRGTDPKTGYPIGRVDRSTNCKLPNGQLIDFHAPRKGWEHADKIKEVLTLAFGELPKEFDEHVKKYHESKV